MNNRFDSPLYTKGYSRGKACALAGNPFPDLSGYDDEFQEGFQRGYDKNSKHNKCALSGIALHDMSDKEDEKYQENNQLALGVQGQDYGKQHGRINGNQFALYQIRKFGIKLFEAEENNRLLHANLLLKIDFSSKSKAYIDAYNAAYNSSIARYKLKAFPIEKTSEASKKRSRAVDQEDNQRKYLKNDEGNRVQTTSRPLYMTLLDAALELDFEEKNEQVGIKNQLLVLPQYQGSIHFARGDDSSQLHQRHARQGNKGDLSLERDKRFNFK